MNISNHEIGNKNCKVCFMGTMDLPCLCGGLIHTEWEEEEVIEGDYNHKFSGVIFMCEKGHEKQ